MSGYQGGTDTDGEWIEIFNLKWAWVPVSAQREAEVE